MVVDDALFRSLVVLDIESTVSGQERGFGSRLNASFSDRLFQSLYFTRSTARQDARSQVMDGQRQRPHEGQLRHLQPSSLLLVAQPAVYTGTLHRKRIFQIDRRPTQ